MSKLDYRLKRDLYPLLESDGFIRTRNAREWVTARNDVLCALRVVPGSSNDPCGWYLVGEEGIFFDIAIAYPLAAYGQTNIIDDLGIAGVGAGDEGGYLQRTAALPGTGIGYLWDLEYLSPDEAVADVVAAYVGAGRDFFNLWTDPEQPGRNFTPNG